MMPFSPLRTWGLGLLGWAMLGSGLYLLWEWADGIDPPVQRRIQVSQDVATVARPPQDAELGPVREIPSDDQGGWPYLVGGVAILALSCGGYLPARLLLGVPGRGEPPVEPPSAVQWVDRPDGSRLCVQSYGAHDCPTLLLTHGWSLDSTIWQFMRSEWGDRYRVVTWDLAGLGLSKGPANGDYSLEKMAHDLEAVLRTTGPGQVILVSHSIGGMLTQTFARLNPQLLRSRVAGVVLLHTTYTNPLRTAFLSGLWTAIEKPLIVPLNHATVWLAVLAWLSNWQSYLNGSLHIVTRVASFAGGQSWRQLDYAAWLAAKAWPAVVARGNLAMLRFDEQRTLPEFDVPTLVLAARHDRMTRPEASERIESLLPHGLLSSASAGHLAFCERAQEVAALISEFAARHAPPSVTVAMATEDRQAAHTAPLALPPVRDAGD